MLRTGMRPVDIRKNKVMDNASNHCEYTYAIATAEDYCPKVTARCIGKCLLNNLNKTNVDPLFVVDR